ncbi:hypothetical protein E5676_scaffold313G003560 [Cucumis melo var. makuwa]|uniref:SWIM-type domain-containing protein n=1 Tax=Cucumis melo var. makuwa TaxID=1194695 RepID=A0A5A7V9D5_CUCMM|nr:hypothetical protein E6C27_scaffold154G00320 [Cucumis melo var. makuwa]TYK26695.1 hypothetical protein E5676_scaffold313G003560 [Cucumis melo var. makuwa]
MQASSTVIDNCLIDDFRFMSSYRSIPKEIVHKARTNLRVNISYQKAWRAKEHMIKILLGDTVESYALIPRFFDKLVESNPGTCTALEIDDSGHFKFCFMAFGASIEGWKYCRPIISVDGTFLKYYLSSVGFEKWSRAYSHRRSKAASTMKSHLTSWAENILRLEDEKSRRLLVDPISTTEYQVTDGNQQFIVKLNVGCCSCRVWDIEEIPCAHALAVLRMLNLDTYSYVSKFYYRETLSATYNGCQPVGSHFDWRVVDFVMKIYLQSLNSRLEDQENKEFHLLENLVVQPNVPIVIVKDIIVGPVSKARVDIV